MPGSVPYAEDPKTLRLESVFKPRRIQFKKERMCETARRTFAICCNVRLYSRFKRKPMLLDLKAEKKFSSSPLSGFYLL